MSQRREIEARLALYGKLSGILGAMRSFALSELHRVTRHEAAQREVVRVLRGALDNVMSFETGPASATHPPSARRLPDVWLLLGSARGFCGGFNEDVVRGWRAAAGKGPAIAVGQRLAAMMPKDSYVHTVAGAEGGMDAAAVIDRILTAFSAARRRAGDECGLVVCLRDESGTRTQRLLPLPPASRRAPLPPLMNEPPAAVAAGVAEHYLFHQLLALLLRSICVENRMRLVQMESALRHIGRSSEDLARRRNRLRQEEIVEEIEVIAGARLGPGAGA